MREHIYRLDGGDPIVGIEQGQVACLCGRVAADVNDTFRTCTENNADDILVHAGAWRIGDNDIRMAVPADEVFCQDVFHVACIEKRVVNLVDFGIDLRIFYGFRDILYTDDFPGIPGDEVGNGSCTGIEVVDEFVACEGGKRAGYGIEMVCLFGVRLVKNSSGLP